MGFAGFFPQVPARTMCQSPPSFALGDAALPRSECASHSRVGCEEGIRAGARFLSGGTGFAGFGAPWALNYARVSDTARTDFDQG